MEFLVSIRQIFWKLNQLVNEMKTKLGGGGGAEDYKKFNKYISRWPLWLQLSSNYSKNLIYQEKTKAKIVNNPKTRKFTENIHQQ